MMLLSAHVPCFASVFELYARGKSYPGNIASFARQVLPTDPQGSMTLSLTNVVTGSRYRIELLSDGSLLAEGTAGGSTLNIPLDYYTIGSPSNDVKIKVRKATSPTRYKPYETQATLAAGTVTVFIAQVSDE